MAESDKNVRHAVARSTGATTLASRGKDGKWGVECLVHFQSAVEESRGAAWRRSSKPETWCSKCKAIAEGKADRVIGDKVSITAANKARPKASAAKKPAAKKATTATPKAPRKRAPSKSAAVEPDNKDKAAA